MEDANFRDLNESLRLLTSEIRSLRERFEELLRRSAPPNVSAPLSELLRKLPILLHREAAYRESTCTTYARDFEGFCSFILREDGDDDHE